MTSSAVMELESGVRTVEASGPGSTMKAPEPVMVALIESVAEREPGPDFTNVAVRVVVAMPVASKVTELVGFVAGVPSGAFASVPHVIVFAPL